MVDITFNGITMDFSLVENMMDPEIKVELLQKLPGCSEQDLLDAYLAAHQEKYGSDFLQK